MDKPNTSRVSSKELVRDFAVISDRAIHGGPVIVTKNGRDRLVLISIQEFEEITRPRVRK